MYVAGLTLEQASNGAPARGMADGENSAWCIYTPNADFGNAEISELYYPIIYLGRNVEPDSGGYGKFRGGLGHTAVWMIKNTPGHRVPVRLRRHAQQGRRQPRHVRRLPRLARPRRATRIGTNVKELIDAQKPLVHERGDPDGARPREAHRGRRCSNLNVVAPFVTPEQLHEYDMSSTRSPARRRWATRSSATRRLVRDELTRAGRAPRVAADIYGVVAARTATGEWSVDAAATAKKRDEIRAARKQRGVPFKEWWKQERQKVQAREGMADAVKRDVADVDGAVAGLRARDQGVLAAAGRLHVLRQRSR